MIGRRETSRFCQKKKQDSLFTPSCLGTGNICNGQFGVFFFLPVKLYRSEFLTNLLLNTSFKEGAEKVATLGLSHEASEMFVKFLYGFSLPWDDSKSFEIYKELIFYAGMCGLECLQEAVTSVFEENLSKTNVFKIFEILKINKVESQEVKNFVVNNFDTSELLKKDLLDKFPEFAVSILKKDAAMKDSEAMTIFALETTTLKGPNTGPIVQIRPNNPIAECLVFSFDKTKISLS